VPHEHFFRLQFESDVEERQVSVRLDSVSGTAGPIALSDAEADQLADILTALFFVLRKAQMRDNDAGKVAPRVPLPKRGEQGSFGSHAEPSASMGRVE
jgi:hypothetical protein